MTRTKTNDIARLAATSAWLVALVAAVLLSFAAREAGPLAGDEPLTGAVQALPAALEPAATAVRALTTTEVVLALGFGAVLVLWHAGQRRQALALAAVLVVLPFAQAGLKELVDRPRPDPELVIRRTGFTSASYPSGHVMSGTVLYGFLAITATWWPVSHRRRRAVFAAAVALLALNAVANIYMGVHWPSDVLGGTLWAVVLLVPALRLAHEVVAVPARGATIIQRRGIAATTTTEREDSQ